MNKFSASSWLPALIVLALSLGGGLLLLRSQLSATRDTVLRQAQVEVARPRLPGTAAPVSAVPGVAEARR